MSFRIGLTASDSILFDRAMQCGPFLLSFLIHFFCLVPLLLVSPRVPSFAPLRLKGYSVSLVSPARTRPEAQKIYQGSAPPPLPRKGVLQDDKQNKIQGVSKVYSKIPVKVHLPKPIPSKSEVVAVPAPLEPSVSGRFVQEEAPPPLAPPLSPPAPLLETKEEKSVVTGMVSLTGDASGRGAPPLGSNPFPFPYYLSGIENKISARWAPPPLPSAGEKGEMLTTVIRFIVTRDGQIDRKSVAVEKSSGNPFFDLSAQRAIYNANPLLPLPREIREDLRVYFEFRMAPRS